jgi:acyl-CoA thioesterase
VNGSAPPAPAGGPFATATGVAGAGDGRWRASVPPGWDIAGNTNGGVLLSIAARALLEATGRADPVTVTAHYLAPGRPGPVEVAAEVVKAGRRFTTATAVLSDATRPLLSVLGTFGELEDPGAVLVDGGPPDLPAPEACVLVPATETFPPPFMGKVELRLHPDDAGFMAGEGSGQPLVRGWFRLLDDEPIDTVGLLLASDAFPPTIFNARLPVAWTPTLELTVHVRSRPAPGWLACRFATRFITAGFLEEDGEVWDTGGRLVVQSRQLALVPRADPGS